MRSWACCAISTPWSQVKDRRSCWGSVVIDSAMASRTAWAPCPARGGPFLTRGCSPWPAMRGRCGSIVKRVLRSTRVPMAERCSPMIKSPSQWPGTARSSASGGRFEIITSGVMNLLPRWRVRARGTRRARPVRKQATSSRLRAPRGRCVSRRSLKLQRFLRVGISGVKRISCIAKRIWCGRATSCSPAAAFT